MFSLDFTATRSPKVVKQVEIAEHGLAGDDPVKATMVFPARLAAASDETRSGDQLLLVLVERHTQTTRVRVPPSQHGSRRSSAVLAFFGQRAPREKSIVCDGSTTSVSELSFLKTVASLPAVQEATRR